MAASFEHDWQEVAMHADVTRTRAEKNASRIGAAILLIATLVVAVLMAGAAVVGDQNREVRSRLTMDQIDPCSPHLLGSQLAPHVQMELEERCAQLERSMPAQ
jgi:hypothetical protein